MPDSHSFLLRRLGIFLLSLGLDPRSLIRSLIAIPSYFLDLSRFIKRSGLRKDDFKLSILPVLADKRSQSGVASGHYFHQDLWAARKIYTRNPSHHLDIGSRIDGFISHLLVFREVTIVDVRDLSANVKGLNYIQSDIGNAHLDIGHYDSISCLHALEHFGLGRYGDPIDPNGWSKGLSNMSRLLSSGGILYLSVPIGREDVVEFNAHRIFRPITLIEQASRLDLQLITFSAVDDDGAFHEDITGFDVMFDFGCGCFEFSSHHFRSASSKPGGRPHDL